MKRTLETTDYLNPNLIYETKISEMILYNILFSEKYKLLSASCIQV